MSEPDTNTGEHVRITVRQMAGALQTAQVTPYCGRCNVAWPCPQAALQAEAEAPPR
jgi:hypothetical protein